MSNINGSIELHYDFEFTSEFSMLNFPCREGYNYTVRFIAFVLMLRYFANLKEIRYESTRLKRIVADKSYRVIVA